MAPVPGRPAQPVGAGGRLGDRGVGGRGRPGRHHRHCGPLPHRRATAAVTGGRLPHGHRRPGPRPLRRRGPRGAHLAADRHRGERAVVAHRPRRRLDRRLPPGLGGQRPHAPHRVRPGGAPLLPGRGGHSPVRPGHRAPGRASRPHVMAAAGPGRPGRERLSARDRVRPGRPGLGGVGPAGRGPPPAAQRLAAVDRGHRVERLTGRAGGSGPGLPRPGGPRVDQPRRPGLQRPALPAHRLVDGRLPRLRHRGHDPGPQPPG